MIKAKIGRLLQLLDGLSVRGKFIVCLILLVALIAIDLLTSPALALTMLYLAPVSIATWYISERLAYSFSALSVAAWLADGLRFWIELPIILWNTGVRFCFFILFITLLVNLRDSYRREHALARRDPLTGVYNRRAFLDLLEDELARLRRMTVPMTLAYLDLDNFKAINDLLGHSVGDELLIRVATLMRENLRSIDRVARLGGDEFVILMPATDLTAAQIALGRLKATLEDDMRRRHWPVTLSIGAVSFNEAPGTLDQAISLADHTMYAVKRDSKDRLQVIAWGHERARTR